MARLVYSAITSLDGYVADADGDFSWCAPDAEVHAFVNDLERPIGTYLYGRKMYDVMAVWETWPDGPDESPVTLDFATIWGAADKVVFSRTLAEVRTAQTRLVSAFDPAEIRTMKESASRDLSVGGPHLAAEAIRAGLVDEYHQIVAPVVVGGGTPWLPDGVRLGLELVGEHRFASGMVHLHYRSPG